jgi:hypothetical protein
MPDTTIFDLPYPAGADSPNGPLQIQNLAERIEEILAAGIRSSGVTDIAASQSTASGVFVELGTPDRVEDIVLPTNGLLIVSYRALWKSASDGEAAIFLNGDQVKIASASGAPQGQAAIVNPSAFFGPLVTDPSEGLVATPTPSSSDSSFVTTGQLLAFGGAAANRRGGFAVIEAAAGTYDVSIRFKEATVKERRLRVLALALGIPPA